jgi:hypothetical protein
MKNIPLSRSLAKLPVNELEQSLREFTKVGAGQTSVSLDGG